MPSAGTSGAGGREASSLRRAMMIAVAAPAAETYATARIHGLSSTFDVSWSRE